jgi:hypothetical protein
MAFVASVTILTVIAIERYVAIVYPMKSKQLTTRRRLVFFIILIWSIAIFYNVIQLVVFDTEGTEFDGMRFEFCIIIMKIDRRTYYTINFILWYFLPLLLMTAMYTKIGVVLWRSTMLTSSAGKAPGKDAGILGGPSIVRTRFSTRQNRNGVPGEELPMSDCIHADETPITTTAVSSNVVLINNGSPRSNFHNIPLDSKEQCSPAWGTGHNQQTHPRVMCSPEDRLEDELTTDTSSSGATCLGSMKRGRNNYRKRIQDIAQKSKTGGADNVLKSRRKVVRLLVLVVGSFAACTLPFQVRVLIVAWGGNVPELAPPITMLLMFFNSGLNPILYAFFSENFRRAMKEVFVCKFIYYRRSH